MHHGTGHGVHSQSIGAAPPICGRPPGRRHKGCSLSTARRIRLDWAQRQRDLGADELVGPRERPKEGTTPAVKRPASAAGSHPQPRLFGAGLPSRTQPHPTHLVVRPKVGCPVPSLRGSEPGQPHRPPTPRRSFCAMTDESMRLGDAKGQWYYCFKHKKVETHDQCRQMDRMGPYLTQEDAENWRERVVARNKAWEDEEP